MKLPVPAGTVKYIGDLSRQDAKVLEAFGRNAHSILEFGCGGSTQILCQVRPEGARLVSLETDPVWIDRTNRNLGILGIPAQTCELMPYVGWVEALSGRTFDLIFVDGVDDQRDAFARAAYPFLEVDGWILYHDTRRRRDLRNLVELILEHHSEVGEVRINFEQSNLSGFRRKAPERYENWNLTEGRDDWMLGLCDPPPNWPELLPD